MIILYLLLNIAFASEATDKAQEAFIIQSGLKDFQDKLGLYVGNEAMKKAPWLATPAALYGVYKTQCIKTRLGDKELSLYLDKIEVKIPL